MQHSNTPQEYLISNLFEHPPTNFCLWSREGKYLGIIPSSVWCCGDRYEELSERSKLIDIDVNCSDKCSRGTADIKLNKEGTCDSVILWMDIFIDEDRKFQVPDHSCNLRSYFSCSLDNNCTMTYTFILFSRYCNTLHPILCRIRQYQIFKVCTKK